MLKKTIAYVDYDGNSRSEEYYFNLNKAELMEMELSCNGGLGKTIEKIIAAQESEQIVQLFKTLILKAYGKKSLDGKRFEKNQEIRDSFEQTEAYSELFMELATNADAAANFVNGVTPKIDTENTNI